jgi:hypothetical protein
MTQLGLFVLNTYPAKPTIPSSVFKKPKLEAGITKSTASEMKAYLVSYLSLSKRKN